jgi:hypothetical protein
VDDNVDKCRFVPGFRYIHVTRARVNAVNPQTWHDVALGRSIVIANTLMGDPNAAESLACVPSHVHEATLYESGRQSL